MNDLYTTFDPDRQKQLMYQVEALMRKESPWILLFALATRLRNEEKDKSCAQHPRARVLRQSRAAVGDVAGNAVIEFRQFGGPAIAPFEGECRDHPTPGRRTEPEC